MAATPVPPRCPACDADATSQRGTYVFSPANLCLAHRTMWMAEDKRQHAAGQCPHAPAPCRLNFCSNTGRAA